MAFVLQSGDSIAESSRLKGYFCSKTLNEPELRNDFEEISRRMQCKWHFRNEVSENFSETPSFRPKSVWKPPKGHASLEVFLSRLEKELF